jgi:hypothetical protein
MESHLAFCCWLRPISTRKHWRETKKIYNSPEDAGSPRIVNPSSLFWCCNRQAQYGKVVTGENFAKVYLFIHLGLLSSIGSRKSKSS